GWSRRGWRIRRRPGGGGPIAGKEASGPKRNERRDDEPQAERDQEGGRRAGGPRILVDDVQLGAAIAAEELARRGQYLPAPALAPAEGAAAHSRLAVGAPDADQRFSPGWRRDLQPRPRNAE